MILSLLFSNYETKEMGIDYMSLRQAASNKVPKDIILNWFFTMVLSINETQVVKPSYNCSLTLLCM